MPRKPSQQPPKYRQKTVKGYAYGCVTLRDSRTGGTRDYMLGAYGSPESRAAYAAIILDWEKAGRQLPANVTTHKPTCTVAACGPHFASIARQYLEWLAGRCSSGHYSAMQTACRAACDLYGHKSANTWGAHELAAVREELWKGNPEASPPRQSLSRQIANRYTRYLIIGPFKHAVLHRLVDSHVLEALKCLPPLTRRDATKTGLRDSNPRVCPVPDSLYEATLPHLPHHIREMVKIQRATGMRPGELLAMRTCDIITAGEVWTYKPSRHKNEHRGLERTVYLGPEAIALIKPWLRPVTTEFLFQTSEGVERYHQDQAARRTTPMSCGNRRCSNRRSSPQACGTPKAGEPYTVTGYARTIRRACDRAFPLSDHLAGMDKRSDETQAQYASRVTAEAQEEVAQFRRKHRWHPHQLRHNFATAINARFGPETARILCGHHSLEVTKIYAEDDKKKAIEAAAAAC